jgi:hypothetical protein
MRKDLPQQQDRRLGALRYRGQIPSRADEVFPLLRNLENDGFRRNMLPPSSRYSEDRGRTLFSTCWHIKPRHFQEKIIIRCTFLMSKRVVCIVTTNVTLIASAIVRPSSCEERSFGVPYYEGTPSVDHLFHSLTYSLTHTHTHTHTHTAAFVDVTRKRASIQLRLSR